MKKHLTVFGLLLFSLVVPLFSGCNENSPESQPHARTVQKSESPQRLISTVPSITEILFDIGLGDRIVGDSKFSSYPPETNNLEKIGDLYDVNWEKIVSLKPDLMLILIENEQFHTQSEKMGIETLVFDHQTMEGVLQSYDLIGERFGLEVKQAAQTKKAVLEEKLHMIQSQGGSHPPVRVLICIDRTRGSGQLQNMYVAGTNPYFQDAIRWVGGINVAESTGIPIPVISPEAIVAMNPDVIVDLLIGADSEGNPSGQNATDLTSDWKTLGDSVNAVKTGRIHVFTEEYATVPGPRTPLFLEKLLKALHGEG